MKESIEKRVARGAAWLDKGHPGWEYKIDLGTLELADGCLCVLGQVRSTADRADGFYVTAESLHGRYVNPFGYLARRGFTKLDPNDDWMDLNEAWRSLLKERFSSGNLSAREQGLNIDIPLA